MLVMVDGNLDAVQYTNIMEDSLVSMMSNFYGKLKDWVYYQKYGASSDRIVYTQECFLECEITEIS